MVHQRIKKWICAKYGHNYRPVITMFSKGEPVYAQNPFCIRCKDWEG